MASQILSFAEGQIRPEGVVYYRDNLLMSSWNPRNGMVSQSGVFSGKWLPLPAKPCRVNPSASSSSSSSSPRKSSQKRPSMITWIDQCRQHGRQLIAPQKLGKRVHICFVEHLRTNNNDNNRILLPVKAMVDAAKKGNLSPMTYNNKVIDI